MNKKVLFLCTTVCILITNGIHAQAISTDSSTPSYANAIRISPNYSGNAGGLGFKINYERNIDPHWIAFGSFETVKNNFKSYGLGIKYRSFNNGKFENLIGLEVNRNDQNNSKSMLPNTSSWSVKTSIELRYNFAKRFFVLGEGSVGYNFSSKKAIIGYGLGVGMRF